MEIGANGSQFHLPNLIIVLPVPAISVRTGITRMKIHMACRATIKRKLPLQNSLQEWLR